MSPQEIVYSQINNETTSGFNPEITPIPGLEWKPLIPTAAVITIPITVAIILVCIFVYYFKAKRLDVNKAPSGYVLMVEMMVLSFQKMTIELLGERYVKLTPYFLMLMLYISVSNLLGILGLTPPTGSLTVTFSMGLVTFIGTIYMGFKHQRLSYLKVFAIKIKVKGKEIPIMVNPLSIISEVAPLLSISMRLWGNIFAGSMIMGLLYSFVQYIFSSVNPMVLGLFLGSTFGGIIAPAFHSYFDVMIGLIQAYVFVMLTYTYWANTINEGKEEHQDTSENEANVVNLGVHDRI